MTKRMKWEKSQSLELGGDTRTTSTEFSFVDSFNLIITSVLFFLCARPDVPRRVQLVCTARQFLPGYNFRRGFQAGYEVETALDGPVDIAISFRQDKKRIFRRERWEKCGSERLLWIESNEVWREEVAATLLSQTGHDKLRFEFNELVLPSASARQNLSASLRQPDGHEVKWRKRNFLRARTGILIG